MFFIYIYIYIYFTLKLMVATNTIDVDGLLSLLTLYITLIKNTDILLPYI